ncbi:MAG: hypothetical protein OXU81_02105 [Gammaproteobacteria bacterium]|nr:hypothetical protein [Gammaproteobacteria bacterium]
MDIDAILAQLPAAANTRPDLVRLGRHCDVEFLLEVGSRAFQVTVEAGRVTGVHPGPLKMRAWRFAIRADETTWREFWSPVPRPGFNDIFAMASYGHARIEGDVGPLLEHLRYLKEVAQLPRSMLATAP